MVSVNNGPHFPGQRVISSSTSQEEGSLLHKHSRTRGKETNVAYQILQLHDTSSGMMPGFCCGLHSSVDLWCDDFLVNLSLLRILCFFLSPSILHIEGTFAYAPLEFFMSGALKPAPPQSGSWVQCSLKWWMDTNRLASSSSSARA